MKLDRERGKRAESEASVDRRFRIVALVIGMVLWVAITAVATELVGYNRNTVQRNGSWISSKPLMQVSIMGAQHFLFTRNALSRNRLSLGEWFGYNEVHLVRALEPKALETRFQLGGGAYLDVIVDRRESGHQGIRLSRADRFPSEWYRAERSGRVVERSPLPVSPTDLEGDWHQLTLLLSQHSVDVSLDGARVGSVPLRFDGERFVGFGAGQEPATLDDVRIVGRNGEVLLDETFRNRRDYGPTAAASGALALLAGLFGATRARSGTGRAMRTAVYRRLTAAAVVLVVLTGFYAFDYWFWSARYAYGTSAHLPRGVETTRVASVLESLRARLFATRGGTIGTLERGAPPRGPSALRSALSSWDGSHPLPERSASFRGRSALPTTFLSDDEIAPRQDTMGGTRRVAFLGTSQTWGVGAETISATFVARVHERLAAALGADGLETFNLAIPGSRSQELLRRYRTSWHRLRPDLLVVNLTVNDPTDEGLIVNLRALTEETRRSGGRIVFVLEALSTERGVRWLQGRHQQIARLGDELGVPVWDLHGYLASDEVFDSGRLWWDSIHLSSYGQSLTADWLAPRILPLLTEHGRSSDQEPAP